MGLGLTGPGGEGRVLGLGFKDFLGVRLEAEGEATLHEGLLLGSGVQGLRSRFRA